VLFIYYRFPDDNDLKQKWMQVLGVSLLKKHLRVCSDHFDANLFHDTGGYTTIRRLRSNAVPSIITNTKVILLLSNITNEIVDPVTQNIKKSFYRVLILMKMLLKLLNFIVHSFQKKKNVALK